MLDLSRFRVEKYTPNRESADSYGVVFPILDGLGSMVVNLFLYRLNNVNTRNVVYLTDSRKVSRKDVETGLYTESDIGLKRAEAITQKYAGFFDNVTIVDVVRKKEFSRDDLNESSILYVDLSGTEQYKTDFDELFRNQLSTEKFLRNNFYLSHVSKGMKDIIRYKAISEKLIETEDSIEVDERRVIKRDKYLKNVLTSRLVVATLNNIVTEGRNLNFQEVGVNMMEREVMEKSKIPKTD